MGLVLDTSALVHSERAGRSLLDLLAGLGTSDVAVPAIVVAELLVGVRLADSPRRAGARQSKIDALLQVVPVIEFGPAMAPLWADHFAALERAGSRIPSNDLTVAATATFLGCGVVVGRDDEKHFRLLPKLRVVALPS